MFGRLCLSAFLVGVLLGAASAADMPVAPAGPAYYPGGITPVPYYNWTGVYVGGNAGGAWANQSGATTTDAVTGAFVSTSSGSTSGFIGGGQIGANWFFSPNFVLGIEGDFDALTNENTLNAPDGSNQHVGKLKFLSTARGRFGLTADRFMLYGTGGFAWGQNEVTRTQITGSVNNATPGTVETITNNRIGWTAGVGVDYAFASNWIARLEYLYVQLDAVNYTFPLAQRITSTPVESINVFRVGVNYQFGYGDPVPARY